MDSPTRSASDALLRSAARQPMLDADEERRLALRTGAGDDEAAHRLVASHLRFVVKIARGYRGWGEPMADLVQEGTLGLIRAVRKFNPDRGVRLSTYAAWSIRAAIQDYVVRSQSLVRVGTTNAQKAMVLRLRQIIGGAEDLSEEIASRLAKGFGTTASEVAALARRISGDHSIDGRGWLGERLAADGPTPEQAAEAAIQHRFLGEIVAKAMAMLPPREQLVIRRRYLEEARHTFEAIGRELNLSKDRVRQLEAAALARLRDSLGPVLAREER